ncbi:response regulator [Marinobacter sp. NFXS9]|uniref:response regulator n=1 Tax=Marinobacter sp. NFXS9 TaxID=2818433 RepID=UPI0032DEEE67
MSKKIFIVDDSSSMRQLVRMTLREAGYEVQEAFDGQDALQKLQGNRVNLVISDVNMPRMDGISLLRNLKQDSAHRFTPVLMLTTESEQAKKAEGQAAGAKAWMVKPFQPAQLLAAVQKLTL